MGGSIRLFRVAGIQVSLHFSWFLVAVYQLTSRNHQYASPAYAVFEYLSLFLIVLLHEFGHALACRQVGGIANQILLWPFGGIAFVQPPPRPGAELWSIAAGPLVNVALVPILAAMKAFIVHSPIVFSTDVYRLVAMIGYINLVILVFNLLPIYPLDGGQILRSLLWFPFGRIRSLQIASVIGLIGGALIMLYAFTTRSLLFLMLTFFLMSQAIAGWKRARVLQLEADEALRRPTPEPAPRPPVL